jgi:uncharacterized membrane protein YhaH (DUF805 family)
MIQDIFGNLSYGKTPRLRYALLSLLLAVIVFFFIFASILATGVVEKLASADLQNIQQHLLDHFSRPFLIVLAIVGILYLFGQFNLAAKRCRDIGLPGWLSVLAILIVMGAISYYASSEISSGVNTLIWLALSLTPSNVVSDG